MRATKRRLSQRAVLWMFIGAGVLLLVAANSHLVYVATISQPGCVAHAQQPDGKSEFGRGQLRAAVSSCSLQ